MLDNKMTELGSVHANYIQLLFESKCEESVLEKELESGDKYKSVNLLAKLKNCRIVHT